MAKKKATINVSKKKAKPAKSKKAKKKEGFSLADIPEDVMDRARDIWLAGLGALSSVEEEGAKMFSNLVKKGEAWEKAGRKQLGAAKAKLGEAYEKVEETVEDVASKSVKTTKGLDDKMAASVEASVEKVMQRLGVPTRAEVKDLAGKVETLSARVGALAAVMEKSGVPVADEAQVAPARKMAPAKRKSSAKKKTKTTVFHLVSVDDGWAIKKEGTKTPVSTHGTKKEALDVARTTAQAAQPSRLVIHKQDGTIQESVSYEG
ncbi:MAG TPA: phasin family protein [Rhodothermales bacterium]|nr:phasin family protein [Rhodothermales bacterium]